MILHCTPPYRPDIPHPALGYLKGFLEDKGIHTKNVYWNLILFEEITNFYKRMGNYPMCPNLSHLYMTVLHIGRHLLTTNNTSVRTPFDAFFSMFFTKEETSELVTAIKTKIDTYIVENNLHETDLAGFPLKTHQWLLNYYIMGQLKEMNPDITIVIGGITDQEQGKKFLDMFNYADYAVYGEGEYPLYYLAEAVETGASLKEVPNLVYTDSGMVVSNPPLKNYPHLDEYPFADHTEYFETLHEFVPGEMPVFIPILGSRGCPWGKCNFCVLNEGYTYRTRSPESVIDEMEYQSGKYKSDYFVFVDTEFAGSKKRFKTLLKLLVQSAEKRGSPYHICAEASPTLIDTEAAALIQHASFDLLQIGFEALTDTLLEKVNKRHRVAHNIQALKLGSQYNLEIRGNVLSGIPPETRDDVLESCENLVFLRFFFEGYPVLPNPCALHKGSTFYNNMSEPERTLWSKDFMWDEIGVTGFIPEGDKFEFFCTYRNRLRHYILWDTFVRLLRLYGEKKSSYTWTDYKEYSVFEETGSRDYTCELTKDETDILVFCDSVKKFSEIISAFPRISEENLKKILKMLKERLLLYHDKDMTTVISILDASKKTVPVR
jgi:radical SAM superfamily enzyme YgiQ (UPF0313 family)